MMQVQSMAGSDSFAGNNMKESEIERKLIHSGHFMDSRIHEEQDDEDDDEETIPSTDASNNTPVSSGYDFFQAKRETSQTYHFGPKSTLTLSIDESLTKLFECMTLAYSGKITSPKWKPFRGMHLSGKDKVRLNNIIWREWHMQYIFHVPSVICQFATPFSDDIHTKPEAIVLEGKYWKRRLDTVTKEYKKWRRYYKARLLQTVPEMSCHPLSPIPVSEQELLERLKEVGPSTRSMLNSSTDLCLLAPDSMEVDFTDDLFACLNQPFPFPNRRELSQFGQMTCADLIQPGLVQLQPSLEDFMDIDTVQEFLAVAKTPSFSSLASGPLSAEPFAGLEASHPPHSHLQNNTLGTLDPSVFGGINGTVNTPHLMPAPTFTSLPPADSNSFSTVDTSDLAASSALRNALFSSGPSNVVQQSINLPSQTENVVAVGGVDGGGLSTLNQVPQRALHQQGSVLLQQLTASHQTDSAVNSFINDLGLTQGGLSPVVSSHHNVSSFGQASLNVNTSSSNRVRGQTGVKVNVKSSPLSRQTVSRRGVTNAPSLSTTKKDNFSPSQSKTLVSPKKPRSIAPAPSPPQPSPSPSPSTRRTCLARLLEDGVYAGALINVKEEPNSTVVMRPPSTTVTPVQRPARTGPRRLAPAPSPPTPATAATAAAALLHPARSGLAGVAKSGTDPKRSLASTKKMTGVDFPTSVVLAAASSALRSSPSCLKDALQHGSPRVVSSAFPSGGSPSPTSSGRSPGLLPFTPSSVSSAPASSGPVSLEVSSLMDDLVPTVSSTTGSLTSPTSAMTEMRTGSHPEHKRAAHLSSEKQRRGNIKTGFDFLLTLVPSLAANPKVSKANMLQKTAEHISKMKEERQQMLEEARILRQEIEIQNEGINQLQAQLPETGVPVTRQRMSHMNDLFEAYVQHRTMLDWKFWIFSNIMHGVFDSYNNMVSVANVEELCRTTTLWLEQHCTLMTLRPLASRALRDLSITTSILTDPGRVKEQATQAATRSRKDKTRHTP